MANFNRFSNLQYPRLDIHEEYYLLDDVNLTPYSTAPSVFSNNGVETLNPNEYTSFVSNPSIYVKTDFPMGKGSCYLCLVPYTQGLSGLGVWLFDDETVYSEGDLVRFIWHSSNSSVLSPLREVNSSNINRYNSTNYPINTDSNLQYTHEASSPSLLSLYGAKASMLLLNYELVPSNIEEIFTWMENNLDFIGVDRKPILFIPQPFLTLASYSEPYFIEGQTYNLNYSAVDATEIETNTTNVIISNKSLTGLDFVIDNYQAYFEIRANNQNRKFSNYEDAFQEVNIKYAPRFTTIPSGVQTDLSGNFRFRAVGNDTGDTITIYNNNSIVDSKTIDVDDYTETFSIDFTHGSNDIEASITIDGITIFSEVLNIIADLHPKFTVTSLFNNPNLNYYDETLDETIYGKISQYDLNFSNSTDYLFGIDSYDPFKVNDRVKDNDINNIYPLDVNGNPHPWITLSTSRVTANPSEYRIKLDMKDYNDIPPVIDQDGYIQWGGRLHRFDIGVISKYNNFEALTFPTFAVSNYQVEFLEPSDFEETRFFWESELPKSWTFSTKNIKDIDLSNIPNVNFTHFVDKSNQTIEITLNSVNYDFGVTLRENVNASTLDHFHPESSEISYFNGSYNIVLTENLEISGLSYQPNPITINVDTTQTPSFYTAINKRDLFDYKEFSGNDSYIKWRQELGEWICYANSSVTDFDGIPIDDNSISYDTHLLLDDTHNDKPLKRIKFNFDILNTTSGIYDSNISELFSFHLVRGKLYHCLGRGVNDIMYGIYYQFVNVDYTTPSDKGFKTKSNSNFYIESGSIEYKYGYFLEGSGRVSFNVIIRDASDNIVFEALDDNVVDVLSYNEEVYLTVRRNGNYSTDTDLFKISNVEVEYYERDNYMVNPLIDSSPLLTNITQAELLTTNIYPITSILEDFDLESLFAFNDPLVLGYKSFNYSSSLTDDGNFNYDNSTDTLTLYLIVNTDFVNIGDQVRISQPSTEDSLCTITEVHLDRLIMTRDSGLDFDNTNISLRVQDETNWSSEFNSFKIVEDFNVNNMSSDGFDFTTNNNSRISLRAVDSVFFDLFWPIEDSISARSHVNLLHALPEFVPQTLVTLRHFAIELEYTLHRANFIGLSTGKYYSNSDYAFYGLLYDIYPSVQDGDVARIFIDVSKNKQMVYINDVLVSLEYNSNLNQQLNQSIGFFIDDSLANIFSEEKYITLNSFKIYKE